MADLFIDSNPQEIFSNTAKFIKSKNLKIAGQDFDRPWGGFFVIDEGQAEQFIEIFFRELNPKDFSGFSRLSPKILLVAPGKRLSWQYHHRRAEIWKVIEGETGVIRSETDEQGAVERFKKEEIIRLEQGERHRLAGLENWAAIAEIWKHTDPENPSDEEDIVRISDDFGR